LIVKAGSDPGVRISCAGISAKGIGDVCITAAGGKEVSSE
jgi:hypothetical protein